MGKKKSPVEDAIAKFVRDLLNGCGELTTQEIKDALVRQGFKASTYENLRPRLDWINSRKDAKNKTYWFVKKEQVAPFDQPRWSFPSIALRTLNRKDTARMLRTTDDPLLQHLLTLLEDDEDEYQKGREEALNKVEDLIDEVECRLDADSSVESAFDTLRRRINRLRAA